MSFYPGKSFFHITFLFLLFPIFLSCSTGNHREIEAELVKPKQNIALLTKGNGPKLSEAILKNLSQRPIDENRRKLLKTISMKSGAAAHSQCLKKFNQAPECEFLRPEWNHEFFVNEFSEEDEENGVDSADTDEQDDMRENGRDLMIFKLASLKKESKNKHKKRRKVQAVYENLKKGIIQPAPHQQEGDYYHALKKFQEWSPTLEKLADQLLKNQDCADPELYHYLGLKAEEFMPDEKKFNSALGLYRRLDECFKKDPKNIPNRYTINGQFRLGLFLVMKNDCKEAQNVFSRLAKISPNDYSSRAYYWSAYCSEMGSKKDDFISNFAQLFKVNPLGFHTLKMTSGSSILDDHLNQSIDPVLKTVTSGDPKYNVWIAAIEDLDKIGDYKGVMKLLSPARLWPEFLSAIDPGAALYLATFSYRVKDSVSLFRILDSVFRNQSDYVVDSTLKLFYPIKYLESISQKVTRVNPFLITALIRQESAFQEQVKSRVGAVGLMQLMPRTAKLMDRSVNRRKLLNPEVNLRVGIRYFEMLVDRFKGDVELALAAYNAGPEAVDRWKKRYQVTNRLMFLDLIPFSETRNYVTLIGRNYYWYSKIYAKDMKSVEQNSTAGFPEDFRSMKSDEK